MRFSKIIFVFLIAAFACEDPLGFDEGFGDSPLDCGGFPCPIDKDDPPPPPPPPPVSRYDIGFNTGEDDAENLFLGAFREIDCSNDEESDNDPDDLVDIDPPTPEEDEINPPGDGLDYGSTSTCYVPQYSGSRTQFNQEVIGYRQLTQNKIDNGLDVQFNQGLLDGFNQRLLQYSVNYGISMP